MSKTVMVSNTSWSLAASTTRYGFLSSSYASVSATESQKKVVFRTAGVFSNLLVQVLTNDRGASTYRTRKATANGNMICSITSSTTGKFEDTVNVDVVAAGDDWHSQMVTGSGGTVFTVQETLVLFDANSNTSTRLGGGDVTFNTASATVPVNIGGTSFPASGADAVVGITYRTAGTLKNLLINIRTNARTTTTSVVSRINSATGALAISITASTTGVLEDTTHSDTVNNGDLVNCAIVSSTGTENLVYDCICVDFESTNGSQMYIVSDGGGDSQAAGLTRYYTFAGAQAGDATEANVLAEINLAMTLSKLQIYISANTDAINSTLTLRKNSADANQVVTITALTTGLFTDSTHTDSVIESDTLDYKIVTSSVSTGITITSISILGTAVIVKLSPLSITTNAPAPITESKFSANAQSLTIALVNPLPNVLFLASALSAAMALQTSTRIVNATPNALQALLAMPNSIPLVIAMPGAQAITLLLVPPTTSGASSKTFVVTAFTMALSLQSPIPAIALNINAQTIQSNLPGQSTESKISASVFSIAMALPTPSKECLRPGSPLSLTSLLGGVTPQSLIKPSAQTFQFILSNPSIAVPVNTTVSVPALSLLFSLQSVSVVELLRAIKIFTHDQQHKSFNKANALRRISRNSAAKRQGYSRTNSTKHQTHAGL